MNEDEDTDDLTINEKLDLILQRLSALEDDRRTGTRPLLDKLIKEMIETRETLAARLSGVENRLSGVEQAVQALNCKFNVINEELLNVKGEFRGFDERMTELERKPN